MKHLKGSDFKKKVQLKYDKNIKIHACGYVGPINPISTNSKYVDTYFLNNSTGDLFVMNSHCTWEKVPIYKSYYYLDTKNKIWKVDKFNPEDNPHGLQEESSFAVLFP